MKHFQTKRVIRSLSNNTRKSRRAAVVPAIGHLLLAVCVQTLAGQYLPAATYYVDDADWSNGTTMAPSDTNPGTQAAPFASLAAAVEKAASDNSCAGDVIYVKEGVYRGYTHLENAKYSGSPAARFIIQADPAATTRPVFKGSKLATGWTLHSGNVWKTTWADGSAPHTSANAQQVFVDGVPLTQMGVYGKQVPGWFADVGGYGPYILPPVGKTLADMAPGRFFLEFRGDAPQTLYVQLPDNSNPNNHTMEVSCYQRLLIAGPNVNYIDIKGLAFQHSNSSTNTRDDSAVRILSNISATVSDCDISYNDFAGLNASGDVQVLNNHIHHNGQMGITANGDYVPETGKVVVRGNRIDYNNTREVSVYHAAGGIKVALHMKGMIVEGNEFSFNKGPGVWFDIDCGAADRPNVIRNNYIHDNFGGNGSIMYEISKYGLIYNNLIVNNRNTEGGVYISTSSGTKVYNNTIYGHTPQKACGAITLQNHERGKDRQGAIRSLKNNTVMNNIVANTNGGYEIAILRNITSNGATGNVVDYNLYWNSTRGLKFRQWAAGKPSNEATSLSQWQDAIDPCDPAARCDAHGVSGEAAFISTSNADFRTSASGAGVDKGTTLPEVTADYGGVTRPSGKYDIGAREVPSAGAPMP